MRVPRDSVRKGALADKSQPRLQRLPQLVVPRPIERAAVFEQLAGRHPVGQPLVFRHVADALQLENAQPS